MSLSVLILTKNSASTIRRCLDSVKWANEIIVLDSGSTDDTIAICREYTPHIHETDWPGFGPQRIRALAKATQDWVMCADDDEEVSPALQDEIKQVLQNPPATVQGYIIKHQIFVFGQPIRYASGDNSHVTLFRREAGQYSDDQAHEHVIINGQLAHLQHPIYHYSLNDLSEMQDKINRYSSLGAQKRLQQNKKSSFCTAVLSGAWMFFRSYFLRKGFLDGKVGFILAVYIAENSYYKHLKTVYRDL